MQFNTNPAWAAAAIALLGAAVGTVSLPAQSPAQAEFDPQVAPLLSKYCISCHSEAAANSDIRLD